MKVFQFPLTKITLGFIFGILLFFYIKPNPNCVFSALIVCVLGLFVSYFATQKLLEQTKTFGVFTILVAFFIGMTSQLIHDDSYNKHVYYNQIVDFNGSHNLQVILQE